MSYFTYKEFLAQIFPEWKRVRKLPLNGGMSCPNLDGSRGKGGCSYCNNKSFSPVWDKAQVDVQEQIAEFLRIFSRIPIPMRLSIVCVKFMNPLLLRKKSSV